MKRNRLNQGHSVPIFVDRFGSSILKLKATIEETRNISHTVGKGDAREDDLKSLIDGLLPSVYNCVKGEVVDLYSKSSPSFDIMFYDASRNFPFFTKGTEVLPAEALLASIEVKSVLNSDEVRKSQEAAKKLRKLKPFKKKIAGSGKVANTGKARYFHTLFAYSTNLTGDDWASQMCDNFSKHLSGKEEGVEMVYVLGKGLILPSSRKFIPEKDETAQALTAYWVSIFNFLGRENARRKPVPYFSYAADIGKEWIKV